jgi:RNA polymerase sigma factor (sigma-70 family)
LTEEAWDGLLDFLDPGRRQKTGPDRDRDAEARCREITRKLVCFFAGRGCRDAEDLASDTVMRVASKCGEIDTSHHDDPTGYFYGVARNVFHEWARAAQRESTRRDALKRDPTFWSVPGPHSTAGEAAHLRLQRCLARLTQRARRLILSYYSGERSARIDVHQKLAAEFGKSANALRIEVHRVRKALRRCMFEPDAETFPAPRSLEGREEGERLNAPSGSLKKGAPS